MGRAYAVASGKGGVGKTVTAAALGSTLAAAGASVAVVDADLGMANLAPTLGVDEAGPTVHDVLAGDATVPEATRAGPNGLVVVPGATDLDAFVRGDPAGLTDVVDTLAATHDHVFVDTGAGLSTDSVAAVRAADETLLVTTPARESVADAARTCAAAARVDRPVSGVVVTGADEADGVAERLDPPVLGTVPTDLAVETAVAAGVPLADHAPGSPADRAYRALARTLTGVDVADPPAAPTGADDDPATAETDGGRRRGGLLARLLAFA
jgi:septum site-determining protein MinD